MIPSVTHLFIVMFCACTTLASILPFYLGTILCACITLASILSLYLSIFCGYNTLASILFVSIEYFTRYHVFMFMVCGYHPALHHCPVLIHIILTSTMSRFLRRFDQRFWPSNCKNTVDTIGEKIAHKDIEKSLVLS